MTPRRLSRPAVAHMRNPVSLVVIVTIALVVAASAAADVNRPVVRLTPKDQSIARTLAIRRADLAGTGWEGGTRTATPADLEPLVCPGFQPKATDLTIVGATRSAWTKPGAYVSSVVSVMRTPRMQELDWERTFRKPGLEACLESRVGQQLSPGQRLVSFSHISLPRVAPHTAGYLARIETTSQSGKQTADVVAMALGVGRVEISLTAISTGNTLSRAAIVQLARTLVTRAPA